MHRTRLAVPVAALLAAACASAARPAASPAGASAASLAAASVARDSLVPCAVPHGAGDGGEEGLPDANWVAVRAPEFSYCVPASWASRGADRREWRGGGVVFRWQRGAWSDFGSFTTRERMDVQPGEKLSDVEQRLRDTPHGRATQYDAAFGGHAARVLTFNFDDTWYWKAAIADPRIAFGATSPTPAGIALAAAVVRTVRFAADSAGTR